MSIFAKAKLGVSDNQLLLNDFTLDPVYRTTARAASKFQIRQQDLPVPFESGSSDFETLIGSSAYIITGKMYPANETSYDLGLNALRTVCSLDFEQEDSSTDGGYVPYSFGDADGDFSKQIFVKPLFVQLAETTQQGFVQPFTIYCKVKDPTIFGVAKVASTQAANFSQTTGSAVFPITFPVVFGSTLFSVSANAQNNGTIAGYPSSVVIHGPVNNPRVTNTATGEYFIIGVNMVSTSDVLTVVYDKDSFSIDLNGTQVVQDLTSDSTLFKIQPGANVIQLTGTSVSTSAYAEVNFWDTYPLA